MHIFDSYKQFQELANKVIENITTKADEYLKPFSLSLYIEDDYDFSDNYYSDAIAVYEVGSVFDGEIMIALNLQNLYELYNTSEADEMDYDLTADITISIFHEIGHGLIEYFCDDTLFPDNGKIDIPDAIIDDAYDEEELAEDFGRSFVPEYTHTYHNESTLWKSIEYIKKQINN